MMCVLRTSGGGRIREAADELIRADTPARG